MNVEENGRRGGYGEIPRLVLIWVRGREMVGVEGAGGVEG